MNQIDYENLGSRMKELRIKMKLTQAEVAKALNVTPGYISNVENNRTAMSLRILIYYARLLNISLDSLIGRIDSEYRETALDRELSEQVHKMSIPEKQKLLKTHEGMDGRRLILNVKGDCLFPDSPFCNFMVFIVLYQILFPISVIVSHTFLFCLADQFSDQDYNKDNNYKEEQADQHDHY